MTEPVRLHDRSPFITVEMQFRPPLPSELRPYFWGAGMLTFYDAEHRKVREFDLTDLPGPATTVATSTGMSVRDAGNGFGWVLVITLSHDQAKARLDTLGLPHAIDAHERELPE